MVKKIRSEKQGLQWLEEIIIEKLEKDVVELKRMKSELDELEQKLWILII